MNLSDLYSGMDRDPDEQQYIVAEMTELLQHDPTNRASLLSSRQCVVEPAGLCTGQARSGPGDRAGAWQRHGL